MLSSYLLSILFSLFLILGLTSSLCLDVGLIGCCHSFCCLLGLGKLFSSFLCSNEVCTSYPQQRRGEGGEGGVRNQDSNIWNKDTTEEYSCAQLWKTDREGTIKLNAFCYWLVIKTWEKKMIFSRAKHNILDSDFIIQNTCIGSICTVHLE